MAGTSKADDLKFINTFEKELESSGPSGENTGKDSLSMSNFVKDIDAIGRGRYQNPPSESGATKKALSGPPTTTTTTTTTVYGKGITPNTNGPQTDANPTTEVRQDHGVCPNPLPWSPHQHFQGPMCGCHDSSLCHGGTTTHNQSEAKTS